MTLTDAAIADKLRHAVGQSIEVLDRRINAMGTKETIVQRQGADRVLIEVPGLQDTTKLKEIIGQTAKLEFRLVSQPGDPPNEVENLPMQKGGGTVPVQKRVMVDGADLVDAQQSFDQQTGEPDVTFRFNLRGGQKFGQVTSENVGRPFAIVLDGKVISAPVIRSPITGGTGQITGNFSLDEASSLAILLRAGALPAKLTVVEERTVGPGLGQDSIDAGKRAAYVGAALVVVYMITTYGIFGVFADLALAVHILLIFASMVLLGATLTLPGIAGIVFTIGMAVDFERPHLRAHPRGGASRPLGRIRPRRRLPPRLRNHHRFQRHDVRGGAHPLSVRLWRGARLRRLAGLRHSDLGHHRGHHDAHDDRALVSPGSAEEAADMSGAKHTTDLAA